ncbi:alpha/beta fold hydrolase [Nocardioides sp. LML1-1-1.1]|uniref:alpha/beta fold hydrolase n=1 Tax=Nocardioides sp. LML1-1-1.1 TaxID=3135248 RepID=UPI0034135C43
MTTTAADPTEASGHPPTWFAEAVQARVETGTLEFAGADIAYRRWDGPGEQGVLLVHGGAANARWWDVVAPRLGRGPVVAIDLSGHGDSDWRSNYSPNLWVGEVIAACKALLPPRPVLIGHSMGGLVCLRAAADAGELLGGVVVIDSPLDFEWESPEERSALARPSRIESSRSAMESRWRPILDSGAIPPFLLRHVGRHSIAAVPGGYRWKFDPRFSQAGRIERAVPPDPGCRLAYVLPESGLATRKMVERARSQPGGAALTVVPMGGAGHNPMLEDPVALADLLAGVLDGLSGKDPGA